jgi:hypothetical protein
MALKASISSRTLRWYQAKLRNRRSEEDLGTDDPHAQSLSSKYVQSPTWYMVPGVAPNRGPGGYTGAPLPRADTGKAPSGP